MLKWRHMRNTKVDVRRGKRENLASLEVSIPVPNPRREEMHPVSHSTCSTFGDNKKIPRGELIDT